jgi:hypothetical protein
MRWILGPLVLVGCKGGKDDSAGGSDDTGSPDTGATHVTAMVVGTMGPEDVDAIEIIHIVGGAFAEITNVPQFNYLVEGTLPPKAASPPPIGELVCIHKEQVADEEILIDFDTCKDDRSGDVRLSGVDPTTLEFQNFGLFGYTLTGTVEFTVATSGYDFETTGVTVTGNGRTAQWVASGNVMSEFLKDDGLMSLDADVTVTENSTSRDFLVGMGGKPLGGLQAPYPLTWSLEATTFANFVPRRPIGGTISFTASTGTYTANITRETLISEIGIPKDSAPLAGIPDIAITMDAPPVIGITYGTSDAIGIQTEVEVYTATAQTSEIVALAQDCALSQADCDVLAAGIDDKLADEVTIDVDRPTIVSAFGSSYTTNFDPVLRPTEK